MNDSTSPQPVTLTVHSVQPPDLSDTAAATRRSTWPGRLQMLLVLAVCASPVVASYLAYYVFKPEGRTNYGELIAPPRQWPAALPLATLQGTAVAPASLAGQWLLLTVGPAACDDACERRLLMQRQLREMLGRERDRLEKVWLVTDDAPLRPDLQRALEATPATTVLRVPAEAVATWLVPAQGQQVADHLYLVDPRGQWVLRWNAQPEPARVRRDIDRLLRASSSWDRAGR